MRTAAAVYGAGGADPSLQQHGPAGLLPDIAEDLVPRAAPLPLRARRLYRPGTPS
ncbi:hypothetical protein ACRAWF_32760 [Streptomyces sp. L7]